MRNSDIIFFSVIIGMLLVVLTVVTMDLRNPVYLRFWWVPILIIIFLKWMYMIGIRRPWIVKITNWLESTNNPIQRYLDRKFKNK